MIPFAVTDDRLTDLETQLGNLIARGFGVAEEVTARRLPWVASEYQRKRAVEARKAIAELADDVALRGWSRRQRQQLAALLREVSYLGMVDFNGEVTKAMQATYLPVTASLGDPQRIIAEHAALYEATGRALAHAHIAAAFDIVADVVLRGLEEGLLDDEIGARLHAEGAARYRRWANTWARTETTRYYTMGRLDMGEEAGEWVWGYRYVVIVDGRTTDICLGHVGKQVAKADLVDVPPLHWNCRTTLYPVMAWQAPAASDTLTGTPDEGFGADPRETLRRAA